MTTINFPRFVRSLRHALHGLVHAFQNENNFRIHVIIGAVVTIAAIAARIPRTEAIDLVLVIASILILELVNTIVERFADLLEPRIHPYVHIIKDLMAASVVVAVVAAIVVGVLIFWPVMMSIFG